MLQEKVSAVTDERTSRVQTGGETDLLPDQSRLGLPTAPTISNSNEPDQVHTETLEFLGKNTKLLLMAAVWRLLKYGENYSLES